MRLSIDWLLKQKPCVAGDTLVLEDGKCIDVYSLSRLKEFLRKAGWGGGEWLRMEDVVKWCNAASPFDLDEQDMRRSHTRWLGRIALATACCYFRDSGYNQKADEMLTLVDEWNNVTNGSAETWAFEWPVVTIYANGNVVPHRS